MTPSGLLVQNPGVKLAVIGTLATEPLREDLARQGNPVLSHEGIVLIDTDVLLTAARQFVADERRRQTHPQEAAAQQLPKLILPDSVHLS